MITRRALGLLALGGAADLGLPGLGGGSADAANLQQSSKDNEGAASNVRYIRPGGAGRHSGEDWQNAAALVDIGAMIASAGPGGTVHLLADGGPYRYAEPIIIARGGAPGRPVKIAGIDSSGTPAKAIIIGNRTTPYPSTREGVAAMVRGKDVFRLRAGADHLHFSFLGFENIGNGAFLTQGDIADLLLEDITARNVTRFVEVELRGRCSITGLTARRVSVEGYSKSAFRLDQDTSNVLMEDVLGDSMHQDFGNFAEGIDLSGRVHDAVFRRCTMRNSQQTLAPDRFWNGDGFTSEKDTYNILFEDCVASGNTDGGFDLKSNNVTLLRCHCFDNTANFKLWGQQGVVMRECLSENPVHHGGNQPPRHLTAPWGANVLVDNCRFTDQNRDAVVYHTDANEKANPPTGSTITVVHSTVDSLGKLSFVDLNSKVSIDGADRPYDGRG